MKVNHILTALEEMERFSELLDLSSDLLKNNYKNDDWDILNKPQSVEAGVARVLFSVR